MMGRAAPSVLLLHGIWMNRHALFYLVRSLRNDGYRASALGYRAMRDGMQAHVAALAREIGVLDADQVHLVGHSMGGIVVLRYLQGNPDRRVRRAVLLGAPATGCAAARQFAGRAAGRWLLGRSLALWGAPFDVSLPAGVEVGAIAGSRAFGLGRLLVRLPAPHDGVVRVEETRFPGLRDHVTLPVPHSAMVVSPAVARQVRAFLENGAFAR